MSSYYRASIPETNLVEINISFSDIKYAHRIFGKKIDGNIAMILVPGSRTGMRFVIPDGAHCVVTENAKSLGIFKPGLYYRSFIYKISHVITTQYIPYHFSVKSCPTRDDVRISIDVDFLLHVTNAETFAHKMGLDNLEQMLRATESEAVRSLVRSVPVSSAYDLRSKSSESMLETLNETLNPFGLSIDQVSIANVSLPADVAATLQEATTMSAKKSLQAKIQELNTKTQDAILFLSNIKEQKKNEIKKLKEHMEKEKENVKNDIKEIEVKTEKQIQNCNAQFTDKQQQIIAQGNFEVAKIDAQRNMLVNDINNNALIECQKIEAEANQYIAKVKADIDYKVAQNQAKIINFKGEAEKLAQANLAASRDYEYQLKKINVFNTIANNPQNLISSEDDNNAIAKLLVSSKTAETMGIKMKKF